MKTKIMTVLLSAASAIFASEQMPTTNELPLEVKHKLVDTHLNSTWFSYMRVAVSDSRPNNMARVLPGVGLGCRFGLPVGAIDLSASYTGTDVGGNYGLAKGSYYYTLPRVSYFLYASPKKEQSFYVGPGLAFGGMKTVKAETFTGLIPSLSVGYEMNRHQNWRSFFQVDVSQPALVTQSGTPFFSLASATLGPIVEGCVGFGY